MRRAVALVGLFGIAAAGISLSIMPTSRSVAAANEPRTFLIPASDGYGVADCISTKAECGKIVADWETVISNFQFQIFNWRLEFENA